MAHRSDREPGQPALMSRQSKPAKQSGTQLADTIRASGREKGRINRPDTRLHPTSRQNIKSSLATREPSTQDISSAGVRSVVPPSSTLSINFKETAVLHVRLQ